MKNAVLFLMLSLTIASTMADEGPLRISAINFDAPGYDNQNINGEWVKITNGGYGEVEMTAWTLSDEGEVHVYIFPFFVLARGNSVKVYSGRGTDLGDRLYMGYTHPVWNNDGDSATLRDDRGDLISQMGNLN